MKHGQLEEPKGAAHARTEGRKMPAWDSPLVALAVVTLLAAALVLAFTMNAARNQEAVLTQSSDTTATANSVGQDGSASSDAQNTSSLSEAEAASGTKAPSAEHLPQVSYVDNVEAEYQNRHMPGGCELISLDIAMKASGVPVDIDELVNGYLDLNGDYATGYAGTPYDVGGGFPPGIVSAANGYLEAIGSPLHAYDLTGISFDELLKYVDRGYPVLVWSTMGLDRPQYIEYVDVTEVDVVPWYDNEHCVVVYGATEDTVLVSDPLKGLIERDREQFVDIYEQCGCMAAIVC